MTKDRKESTKKQIKKTKPNENPTKTSLDTFLKSQQNVVNQLKTDVKNSEMELQKSASLIEEKNKCISGLEINLQKRDSEIEMLNNALKALKEENMQTLKDFSTFRDKFHDLECRYDKYSQILKDEHQELTDKFHKQQIEANNKIQELNYGYKDVQQQLLEKSQAVMKLNEQLLETMRTFEQMKTDFGRQQNDFALYKTKVEEEKRIYEENNKVEFAKLKDKLVHKDEIIKQCVFDKNNLEEEKNRIIEELNHKIRSIERAFTQPTSVVQPMSSTSKPTNEISSNQNVTENLFDNVAITRPQVREPVENTSNVQTTTNNENNNSSDSTPPQRQYKFKRPTQVPISHNSTAASTSNANNNNIKKRRQPVRQQTAKLNLPATAMFNEFSSSSNEDDESDGDVSFIKATQWRPTRPRDMSVQITKKQKTVDKVPQGKLENHSESQLYGKECKNEKMRLLCDEVYCREQNYNYALENSNKITQVVACLLAGVFKKEAIINSTVIGQNSNMLGNEQQMPNSQCLDSTAISAIIAFSKDYGEKQGWPPQADSEIIISMNDSLRKLQCLYKMKNEIKI